nr:N-terminal kinase-like protein [Danaus plexippus plexippus]
MWSFFSRDPTKDFPYEVLDPVRGLDDRSVWTLHKGKKRGTQDEVSIFLFDVGKNSETLFDIAKASLKKLKTMRHPSLLHYLDSCETEKFLYVATEYVEPLATHIENMKLEGQQRDLFLAWGIFQITRALSFFNNDGNMKHNNVCLYSVFVTLAGEWKLGGFEFLAAHGQDTTNPIPIKILPALEIYDPPEKKDTTKLKSVTKCSSDMWGLGCLIWEAFNGPLKTQPALKTVDLIPKQLCTLYCELVSANPASRPNPADIITRCRKMGGYFKNDLIDTMLFLEEIQIKDKVEKAKFFSTLSSYLDNFPEAVCIHKILPQLLTAFHYGDAGSAVLAPMFKLGKLLQDAEYQKQIVPCVVKLFASNDRTTRSRLLQQLDQFIMHLHNATVNDQIFPQVVHGFLDTNAIIREQTVKSIVHLAPKLNYNNINVEVLRHFARLQSKDDQGGIRTNTTVCLGKIATHLHPQIRQKVLVSAFVRATRDSFPPARQAGVLALAATQQYFLLAEVASRILPALCPLTADPEKQVRDAAFRTIKGFLGKLEKVSEDPSLKEGMEADVNTATPSLSNAAATWAGWAVTAVTAKFYRSHSDTARVQHAPKSVLSKPGSLEQPSSSSMSTTTSSVTSMTSLEHSESASDYDPEHWDMTAWGEIDSSAATTGASAKSPGSSGSAQQPALTALCEDDWDNDEWGTLQEQPTAEAELVSPSETWNNSSWTEPVNNANATYVRGSRLEHRPAHQNSGDSLAGWEDGEFEPIEENADASDSLKTSDNDPFTDFGTFWNVSSLHDPTHTWNKHYHVLVVFF